ncbi:LCP family protein [Nocardioides panacisoli]|uniref:LCP family protein n=1 Tax=Nocardioides panacisoli TaxID=627624 RepID=UPI001C6309FA|nr:LCP family protein [Nocardioides panacisoli]QYJ02828.1 LCP family protein [Nocardioides panacisoli]
MSEHVNRGAGARAARRTGHSLRSRQPRSARGKRRGRNDRHTVVKVIGASLLTLAIATAGTVVAVYNHLNGNLDVVEVSGQLTDRPPKGPEGPLNVLVMGSDSREGANNIDGLKGGGARSDTTILLHLSADRERAYGISIPRDTLVDRPTCYGEDGEEIPGEEQTIWNAAFSLGGPACTIQQFEQVSGVRVDNYAVVDFTGFKGMVDALGGVEVCIPEDIEDPSANIFLEAGTRSIKGDEALAYVRVRKGVSGGDGSDPQRIKRQQAFMAATMNKAISGGMLSRPDKMVSFLSAATDSLQTDAENISKLAALGAEFQGVGLGNIRFVTTPWVYSTAQPGRVEWTDDVERLWRVVRRDSSLPGEFLDQSISAADNPDGSTSAPGNASGQGNGSATPETSEPTESESTEPTDSPSQGGGSGLSDEARQDAGLCA